MKLAQIRQKMKSGWVFGANAMKWLCVNWVQVYLALTQELTYCFPMTFSFKAIVFKAALAIFVGIAIIRGVDKEPASEFRISGFIDEDTFAAFQDARGVKKVYFQSQGGDVAAAIRIGRRIRELGASVETAGECSSACVYAFLGGTTRHAEHRLGFHEIRTASGERVPTSSMIYYHLTRYVSDMGADIRMTAPWIFGTNADEMHYPSANDLCRAKIITECEIQP